MKAFNVYKTISEAILIAGISVTVGTVWNQNSDIAVLKSQNISLISTTDKNTASLNELKLSVIDIKDNLRNHIEQSHVQKNTYQVINKTL